MMARPGSSGAALRRRGDAAWVKQRYVGRGGGSARWRRRYEHGLAEEDCERRWRRRDGAPAS
jgi:hypothetical protein